jgi:hypothetical protein
MPAPPNLSILRTDTYVHNARDQRPCARQVPEGRLKRCDLPATNNHGITQIHDLLCNDGQQVRQWSDSLARQSIKAQQMALGCSRTSPANPPQRSLRPILVWLVSL